MFNLHTLRYFTKDGQQGVCIFRRRKTAETGHRGFRLSSLGILLAKSRRPRPQRHVKALKELIETVYSRMEPSGILEASEEDWEPARVFFEERKLRRSDLGGAGDWAGWSEELDGVSHLFLVLDNLLIPCRSIRSPATRILHCIFPTFCGYWGLRH